MSWARILICLFVFFSFKGYSQFELPPLSPVGLVKQTVGFTTISIRYERPAARGRSETDIFGQQVPFGKLWRTGAGLCTKVSFSTVVWIDDKPIPKGTYALFTIPDKDQWVVILNSDTTGYGTSSYDPEKDVLRFQVQPNRSERFFESLTFDIDIIPNDAKIFLSWMNLQFSFVIQTKTDENILSLIDKQLIQSENRDPELYEKAIYYYIWHGLERKQILEFIEKGIALKNHRVWYYWKVSELQKENRYDEALAAAHTAIELIRRSPAEPGYDKKDLVADFEAMIDVIMALKKK